MNDDLEDIRVTLGEMETKLLSIQQQLVGMEIKQNLKNIDNKQDIYIAGILIGAIVFLALRMVPV